MYCPHYSPLTTYYLLLTYYLILAGSTFSVRTCNKAGSCSVSGSSAIVYRVTQEPLGGEVHLSSPGGNVVALHAHTYFFHRGGGLMATWGQFTPVGCPSRCGGSNFSCFYDELCTSADASANSAGCNAGGVGANCRLSRLIRPILPKLPQFSIRSEFDALASYCTSPRGNPIRPDLTRPDPTRPDPTRHNTT